MQIYVVTSQADILMGSPGVPLTAFADFPSAITYAETIFKQTFDNTTAKDLVFMITMNVPATVTPAATV